MPVASAELRLENLVARGDDGRISVGGECTPGRRESRTHTSVKLAERPDSIELDMRNEVVSERGQRREFRSVCQWKKVQE